MPLRALLLDLDGTLIDSNPLHVAAWHTAMRERGFVVAPERIWVEIGKGGDHLVADVLGEDVERSDGDALRRAQGEAYLKLAAGQPIAVLPDARELIAAARARGLRVALATSSKREHLAAAEKSSGVVWRKLVDLTVGADDIANSKPSPDIVTTAATRLELPIADCALIGDTVWDAMSARRAGAVAIGLSNSVNPPAVLRQAGAAEVFPSLSALIVALDDVLERNRAQ